MIDNERRTNEREAEFWNKYYDDLMKSKPKEPAKKHGVTLLVIIAIVIIITVKIYI